ncbi:MAG: hypothetical protein WCR52_14935 [Bacteroidota bacterium]
MTKPIFFSILTTLAFSYCAAPENNKIYTFNCYVRFDESQGIEKAECHVFEGATSNVGVEIPGGIKFQNEPMKAMEIQGVQYRREFKTSFSTDHKFTWTDKKNKEYAFNLPLAPLNNFRFEHDTLHRNQAATFKWDGPSLQKGESMVLLWEQEKTAKTVSIELISQGSESKIEFPAAKLAELQPGDWSLYIVRKRLVKTTINGVSATGISELYTKSRKIKVL